MDSIDVRNAGGIRYGTFDIGGVGGTFPTQAITSTNLNHAETMDQSGFDFGTKILEIIESDPQKIISNLSNRTEQISKIKKTIEENPDKLCLLSLNGIKTKGLLKLSNIDLIDFQIECGFNFIKAYLTKDGANSDDLSRYNDRIPKKCHLVPILDERIPSESFKKLYFDVLKSNSGIIGFLGNTPNKSQKNIKINFDFIRSRDNDRVLRLASCIEKKAKGEVVNSLIYKLYGFDVFSFRTIANKGFWKQKPKHSELTVFNRFKFTPLRRDMNLKCAVTNMNLYDVVQKYKNSKYPSAPAAIYNIATLNKELKILHEKYTRKQLETIAQNRLS